MNQDVKRNNRDGSVTYPENQKWMKDYLEDSYTEFDTSYKEDRIRLDSIRYYRESSQGMFK